MRRTITAVAMVMTFIATTVPAALANQPDEVVYLSLGTSLAAGSQIDAGGNTTFSSEEAYTDQLFQRVKGRIGADLRHEKLGCAGETADTFAGGTNVFGQPSNCAAIYDTGSQLGDALAAIEEGDVVLVTIDLGANDILQAQQVCAGDSGCIAAQVPVIAAKVAQVVGALRVAGYAGPIVGMNYYNPQAAAAIGFFPGVPGQHAPDPTLAGLSDALAQGFNGALAQAYGAVGADVADVYGAFNAGDFGDDDPLNGLPDNVDVLCDLSYMCPADPGVKANIHLNKKGYKVIAKTFVDEIARIDFGG